MNENNQTQGPGMAIASMVLGIVSLVSSCCIPGVPFACALVGLILGGVSLKNQTDGKGMAIAGLVCSIISLIPSVFVIVSGAGILSMLGIAL